MLLLQITITVVLLAFFGKHIVDMPIVDQAEQDGGLLEYIIGTYLILGAVSYFIAPMLVIACVWVYL